MKYVTYSNIDRLYIYISRDIKQAQKNKVLFHIYEVNRIARQSKTESSEH